MHRCSETVAALAAALAKAQAELINPEKSLTATIRSWRTGEAVQTFRYAPLSSGLDIVRKTLGQHEIATVQTTALDQTAGVINLTTILAHASGEWIASDWPVSPISETASPQRMGAALTYARRYALFTLVGIAGEDDLDAPEIQGCPPSPVLSSNPGESIENQNPRHMPPRTSCNRDGRNRTKVAGPVVPNSDDSAALREKLLAEVHGLSSAEHAAIWAREALGAKNSLTAADAQLVEDAFGRALLELPSSSETPAASNYDSSGTQVAAPPAIATTEANGTGPATSTDKSALAIPAPRRYRNKQHLQYVAQQPCLLCARKPSDPHHLRFAQPRALGRKASDEFTVPLCRVHHRAVHRAGDERGWWEHASIDPLKVARKLWKDTRVNEGLIEPDTGK
jgi:ERF superfamily